MTRDEMDCAFLRAHAHYLDTAETNWPYVNSARAIGETGRRVADRMEAKDIEIERLRTALRDLLKYGDDHDWCLIPEGDTIERARNAIVNGQGTTA